MEILAILIVAVVLCILAEMLQNSNPPPDHKSPKEDYTFIYFSDYWKD